MADLLSMLFRRLTPAESGALRHAISIAEEFGVSLYLVGGAVRDLLLDADNLDVDLVLEDDAVAFARALARGLGAKVTAHPRFGTASIKGSDYRLDLASARSEHYTFPGALPDVMPASLIDDLVRRDFSINAMAIALTGPRVGRLIDHQGGKVDLRDRVVRVLHGDSFRDDPTRMFRAVRYAGRLGFRLEPRTRRLLRRDLRYLDSVGGVRLRHELERIGHETKVGKIMRLAQEVGLLRSIKPPVCVSVRQINAIKHMPRATIAGRGACLFTALLLATEADKQTEARISRLSLTARQSAAVRGLSELLGQENVLDSVVLQPSEAVVVLAEKPIEAIQALALLTDRALVRERLNSYLDVWRYVRPRLSGCDIEGLGVVHGPDVGAALSVLRAARLDGRVATRDDEIQLVQEFRTKGSVTRSRRD